MEIQVTRNTGFYGMGSAIELTKNGQKWIAINNNQTKKIEVSEAEVILQASFFFMKSNKLLIKNTGNPVKIEITMNPMLISVYLFFFLVMLLLPIIHFSILGILLLFVFYFLFLFSMLGKAYVVKETLNGTGSRNISE
ncbi:hypothetical protein [Enterococcus rivorum]|uniref:Uncharacterized protein n=1 Tax=Enterococcus rivorum TaxID=762845 RepID=A0A1E5KWI5_9ENTE|nr:hypothetical protein [Enterococcus rivorum]MBP2100037.1 hypothetical protein [Enterococcus rivorum]OEH82233.1 hypothetical protein BCR26_13815 [Enterococcus rivorum]